MSNRIFKTLMLMLGVTGLLIGAAGVSIPGELRQFEPFAVPNQNEAAPPSSNPQASPAVPESFYRDFKTKVRESNAEERKKAAKFFTDKRNEARKANRLQDAEHYQRLLDILANP
jgi:hypothetical protein